MSPRFRIGIDLGTTNCALASIAAGDPEGRSVVLEIPQPETGHSTASALTLPSCLYLPPGGGAWIAGRWARARAAEVPGRVVRSAKSWLTHHAADRRAPFLPLGSTDLAPAELLSPVQAQARLLRVLADAWDAAHPDAPLAHQEVAVTVPASFDPVAQQLTLEAAAAAGFPPGTLLLEEPQAAFYAWRETQARRATPGQLGHPDPVSDRAGHVLVVDLGGGTTDFSLFSVEPQPAGAPPHLRRIAVSEHILLGGDNLDLALAHHVESRLPRGTELPATAFAQLLARCREIKEEALTRTPTASPAEFEPERSWPIAIARPGASLLTGTLRLEVGAREVERLLIEGFFPEAGANERPLRSTAGLREMGLPYARDPAITRHLADFLRDRPPIDFLLCNGGLTKAPAVRERLLAHLTHWQGGRRPVLLENTDPDLAVARGAARFLHLRALGDATQIEAGASHTYYVAVGETSLLCVLPRGTPPEQPVQADTPGLRALVGRPASFPLFRHARRSDDAAGLLVPRDDNAFHELPAIETVLTPPPGKPRPRDPQVAVRLRTTLRSTGLLRIELLCADDDLGWTTPWPLEFSLRPSPSVPSPGPVPAGPARASTPAPASAPTSGALLPLAEAGATAMTRRFRQGTSGKDRLTANAVFAVAEKVLASPRSAWNAALVRALWPAWLEQGARRGTSPEHEETWLQVAGFLLRPGRGVPGDADRIAALWPLLAAPPLAARPAVRVQRWICIRRIASGLDPAQVLALWDQAESEWPAAAAPSAEVALLAGALETLPTPRRADLALRLASTLRAQPQDGAAWKALGRLLSRVLFHAGTDQVIAPDVVVACWEQLKDTPVPEPVRPDAALAWLRAGRRTGLRSLDAPSSCRHAIDSLLRAWDVPAPRRHPLHEVIPVVAAEQAALIGESLPGGLSLASD